VGIDGTEETPEGTIRVDLNGKYLCPGLIDAHVHIAAPPGEKDLQALTKVHEHVILYRTTYVCRDILSRGFTTVRDAGGAPLALKEAIQDGLIPGPRLQIAGHALSQTGGHGDFRNSYEHSPMECGCSQVTGIARICDGVPECLHMARDELRRGADFLKIMGGGGVISPTDAIDQVQFTPEEIRAITSVAMAGGPLANFLPPELKAQNQRILEYGISSLQIAKKAGVTMCYGSDLLGPLGAFQTNEFTLRSKALSLVEILQSATINPAKMMGLEKLGQIKEGFWADLIILNSNPLEDISILDRTANELLAVFKEGKAYYSKLQGVPGSLD
jgi:imidazolonepropionase-like amidohydrolase